MQGIGQPVLHRAGPFLPVAGVGQPVAAVRHIGPGADVGDALNQGLDVAVGALDADHLVGHPVGGQPAGGSHQVAVDPSHQSGVGVAHQVAEVGDAAHLPQQAHGVRAGGEAGDVRVRGKGRQGRLVVGFAGPDQAGHLRRHGEAAPKRVQGGEAKVRVAPEERRQRRETVVLDGIDRFLVQGADVGGGAEGARVHVPSGAPGDLGQFRRCQFAHALPVELPRGGEGHVVDVHVEPHADGVRGHQVVHVAGLIHGDLGVAGARAQGAEHHRRAAALPAHHLGDGVDVGGRERDRGAARGQPGDLALAGIGERREPRPRQELGLGHQPAEKGADGLGAHEHGLVLAAGGQQGVGEDVAAVGVGAHLNLVDAEERHPPVHGHGFHRTQEVPRMGRHDLLLAGDQGDVAPALDAHRPVVVLARQKAQREPDHAAGVAEHALHGEMGLARVRRPEHGDDARAVP